MNPSDDIKAQDSKLFTLYIHELWWLSHAIKTKTEKLFTDTIPPEVGYILGTDRDIHSLIASVLSDAANLKKLLFTPNGKNNKESGRQFRLRKARAEALKGLLAGVQLSELVNVKVRNTLEHFDEYLDEANLAVSEAKVPPSPMAAYNMVLSHWEAISPPVYPIRLYISSERKFYNIKWSVDLQKMHDEAAAIVERLGSNPYFSANETPGALLLPL